MRSFCFSVQTARGNEAFNTRTDVPAGTFPSDPVPAMDIPSHEWVSVCPGYRTHTQRQARARLSRAAHLHSPAWGPVPPFGCLGAYEVSGGLPWTLVGFSLLFFFLSFPFSLLPSLHPSLPSVLRRL